MEHTLVSPTSGNEYVGHVPVGQLTGTGAFRCAKNGAVYTGEYEGKRFHGIGELTLADGRVYRGQFKAGTQEGEGVFTAADGRIYRGQFMAGNFEGDGAYTEADGRSYRGQWKGDQMEGDGVFTHANGDVYRGQRGQGGKEEGDGVFTGADGNVYHGQLKGGKLEGDGVCTWGGGVRGFLAILYGRQTFERYKGGNRVSRVPFDAANPTHAAVLRAAYAAEARRVGAPHRRRERSVHFICVVQARANAAEARAAAAAVRVVPHARNSSGGVRSRL
jgi:hypothetical protein